jgi:glycosyltransferase involved in cell wall biosynthesis
LGSILVDCTIHYDNGGLLRVTVAICCVNIDRVTGLSLRSIYNQSQPPDEILIVVDEYDAWMGKDDTRIVYTHGTGLSHARNVALQEATGDIVVFIDDDAWAEAFWLRNLTRHFKDPEVMIAGGAVKPSRTIPAVLSWVYGCTDQWTTRPIGCNFAMRKGQRLWFNEELGKTNGMGGVGEETELMSRVVGKIVYDPNAVVNHRIPDSRMTLQYMTKRAYFEGRSKAAIKDGKKVESEYLIRMLKSFDPRAWWVIACVGVGYVCKYVGF